MVGSNLCSSNISIIINIHLKYLINEKLTDQKIFRFYSKCRLDAQSVGCLNNLWKFNFFLISALKTNIDILFFNYQLYRIIPCLAAAYMLGFGDGINVSQIVNLLGSIYHNNSAPSFAVFNFLMVQWSKFAI